MLSRFLKWQFTRNDKREEKQKEKWRLKVNKGNDFLKLKDDCIVWLGHASFFLQQPNQQRNAGNVVGRINHAFVLLLRQAVRERQPGVGKSDALELSDQNLWERFESIKERESKARRTAIDGQDGVHGFRFQLRISFYGQGQVSLTTILPTFFPSKRPMNAPTAWSIPSTTVSLFFSLPARK